MTPEGRIKAKLNRELKKLNGVFSFMPVQQGFGIPGLDYFLCLSGLFVAIETKAPGKKPTPRQRYTMERIRAAGGLVFVVDSLEGVTVTVRTLILLQHAVRTNRALLEHCQ